MNIPGRKGPEDGGKQSWPGKESGPGPVVLSFYFLSTTFYLLWLVFLFSMFEWTGSSMVRKNSRRRRRQLSLRLDINQSSRF